MDLVSVVAHELGHLVGLDDNHDFGHAADLMGDSLPTGTRRTPTAADVKTAASARSVPDKPVVLPDRIARQRAIPRR